MNPKAFPSFKDTGDNLNDRYGLTHFILCFWSQVSGQVVKCSWGRESTDPTQSAAQAAAAAAAAAAVAVQQQVRSHMNSSHVI